MNNRITHCIACNSVRIAKKRGGFPVTIRGKTIRVPNIERYVCAECGETFLDLDNEAKIDAYLKPRRTRALAAGKPTG